MEDIEGVKNEDKIEFKKPVLIGRVGKLPKKVKDTDKASEETNDLPVVNSLESSSKKSLPPAVHIKEISTPIPYKEPKWSGLCPEGSDYALEVLKSGMIVEKVELTKKAYFVFGRLVNCDVVMAHPTISRHHAVLQYKAFAEEGEPTSGWYLYDLGSTHGTFLNKDRLKANHYTRVRVGHQIKFGNSSRTYIVLGPDFDSEGETELTVTEIKKRSLHMKQERDRMIQEALEQRERDRVEEEKKQDEQGIDWGMGEDAQDEPDLAENPYASTTNEELYLTDPKKTLRGYFEREGLELNYDCEERGVGQFICRVELPIDDARGRPAVAEVMHRGKKKEAVVAAALEACRVLDRAGLLRQAKHESRARKSRDWSAEDYYDSDEDPFLDRTGALEKKRSRRMNREQAQPGEKTLTYDDLLKQVSELESKITCEEKTLERLRSANKPKQVTDEDEDALDQFMSSLGSHGQTMAQKADISNSKMTIQKLKTELSRTRRLADLARPAHLPPLIKQDAKMSLKVANNSAVYGKRIRLKEDIEKRSKVKKETNKPESEFVEEMDSDEEVEPKEDKVAVKEIVKTEDKVEIKEIKEESKIEKEVKVYGPMRPPEDYMVPENYYDQETERDLPEIMEKE